jgi:hypothetical protein
MNLFGVALFLIGWSYIFKPDNRGFVFNETLYVGMGTAAAIYVLAQTLNSVSFAPILAGEWHLIIPTIIGLGIFTRLTPYRWFSRYSVGIMAGIGLGVTIPGLLQSWVIDAIYETASFRYMGEVDYINGILIFISVLFTIIYYTYSVRYSSQIHRGGKYNWVMKISTAFLFLGFGYTAGIVCYRESIPGVPDLLITYFYLPFQEIKLFLGGPNSGLLAPMILVAAAVPLALIGLHYWYNDIRPKKTVTSAPTY